MKKLVGTACMLLLAVLACPGIALAQTDPGVRPGAINGQSGATQSGPLPLASVNANNPTGILEFFDNGLGRFQEVEVVSGGANNGLGPRFNLNSCSGCHAQPAVGGSGPANNPEFQVIAQGVASGSANTLPAFITPHGPTLEVRFPFFVNSNGSPNRNAPNGGVEDIFTVSGRPDAGSCNLQQPNFQQAQQNNNIIFRIPTPTFGAGLIENIDDSTLMANQQAQAGNNFGIGGTFNRNGNDGTIARFGWKAQNKSLLMFSGEAYNVEMGITNELFTQERPLPQEEQGGGLPASCLNLSGHGYPEDATNFQVASNSDQAAQNAQVPSDVVLFAEFMRLLAPPIPSTTTPGGAQSISNGFAVFKAIGCSTCHTPAIRSTQASNVTASLGNAPVRAFSDFEIHHMGNALADNVSQGGAGGDQFRTAPLWGLGQRIFFLHDGRTTNLLTAIADHRSNGSEATQVAENFASLSRDQQQEVLNFLRSL
ncbi:MAG TPA: di-heme oxidoredictase family protein [Steroidobacteraceae bacterium]|nr:di-heme oxidoredictase family protein [Steroidobacteraceae bacterium]